MKRPDSDALLVPAIHSKGWFSLTPKGHELAMTSPWFEADGQFSQQVKDIYGVDHYDLCCEDFEIAESDFGGAMPPVASWLREPGLERFLLQLLPSQICFEGHFPDHPILAGVIQLDWAVKLAHRSLSCVGQPIEILRLKYHHIAVPPLFVELQLQYEVEHRPTFRILSQEHMHAQGVLVFGDHIQDR